VPREDESSTRSAVSPARATPEPASSASDVTASHGSDYLSHRQILVVMGGLMAGMFLAALDQSIVAVALPKITSELGGLDQLSWVVTAYLLTSTAATPLWGKISDLRGRRPIFQAAIVVFLIGSLICGFSPEIADVLNASGINVMIAGRAVQGLGAGGLMSLALAVIGDVIPPRERGKYQGFHRLGVRGVIGRRTAAGRLVHRQPGLGMDLLDQHPDWCCCAGRHLACPEAASGTAASLGRLSWGGNHCWVGDQSCAVPQLGRPG
jgi:Major Facilitator Superfamily